MNLCLQNEVLKGKQDLQIRIEGRLKMNEQKAKCGGG